MTNNSMEIILKAALETVAKNKISGTRMHLIAKEANMSQSSLHYYFNTKDELLISLLNYIQSKFSEMREIEVDIKNKTFFENLNGFFKNKKNIILYNKEIDYLQLDYWVQGTVDNEIKPILQDAYNNFRNEIGKVLEKAPSDKKNIDTHMLSFIVFSIIMGSSMQYLIDEKSFDLDEYFLLAEKMISKILLDENVI